MKKLCNMFGAELIIFLTLNVAVAQSVYAIVLSFDLPWQRVGFACMGSNHRLQDNLCMPDFL